jgi:hypothetical protein
MVLVIKQEAIGAGVVKSGDLITIKFDVKGAHTTWRSI